MKDKKMRETIKDACSTPVGRKGFLKYAALSGGAVVLGLESCKKDNNRSSPGTIDMGSGDTLILLYEIGILLCAKVERTARLAKA